MTRQAAPVRPPVVLTIAGSDSGGGAGIQADLKTMEAGGAFGTSAITSVTAQNTQGVESVHPVPVEDVEAQIDAVVGDLDVAAVKTGMLGTTEVVELVVEHASDLPHLVVDPVMIAASGDRLLEPEAEAAYADLVAASALVTPNADEAAVLTDVEVSDVDAAREAGERLVEMGADAALVKGGHVPGDDVVDVLVTDEATRTFRHDRIDTEATHGSGCTLSSAIATRLAHGDDLPTAVGEGISLLTSAVRYGVDVGDGPGSVHHLVEARDEAARDQTAEAVEAVVETLVDSEAAPILPAGGTNVVGATPYAESQRDVAGVDGGLGRTVDGLRANRGVRFDAGDGLGPLVLAVREADPTVRFAVACRNTDRVRTALGELDGAVVTIPGDGEGGRNEESDDERTADDNSERLVSQHVRSALDGDERPVALVDGESGKVVLLAPGPDELEARATTLLASHGQS